MEGALVKATACMHLPRLPKLHSMVKVHVRGGTSMRKKTPIEREAGVVGIDHEGQ